MRKWIVVPIVIILVIAGGVVAQQRRRPAASPTAAPAAPDPVAVEVAAVTRGSIERTLAITGTVVSTQHVEVTTKLPGRIAAVLVSDGMRVAAGQVLARIEAAELAAQVSQAEQGLRQAQAGQELARARLIALESGARAQERAQAQNAVAQAEANLRSAEADVTRMQQLFDAGAVSRQQLDAAVLHRDVAKSQLDSARQQASLIQAGARGEELRMARAQVEQADAASAAAAAALRMARVQLAQAAIRAPFAGRLGKVSATRGEFVAPGSTLAVLYDDRSLELDAQVGERDLHLLRAGQAVTVRVDALAAQTLTGRIRVIVPAADPLSRAATVRIRLLAPPAGLLPGTSARGEVLVERRPNALIVPSSAVRENGQPEVIVVKDGTAHVRKVLIGLRHHHVVEIIYGLAEGEVVVTLGPEALSDGQPVKVVSR